MYDGENNHYTRAEGIWDGAGGTWDVYIEEDTDPEVFISAPSYVYEDETIALSAIAVNVTSPVYTFYVT
ncbi:MAG: hypothetical protein LUG18_04605, partial [Candidatus Azobacteroides sp.]|nr:hypothetical protein [Candidatus Azobacteroides sp.]